MPKKIALIALYYVFVVVMNPVTVQSQTEMQGDIIGYIEMIRNAMPGINSNGFDIPTTAEKNYFGDILSDMMNMRYDSVQSKAEVYGYEFIRWYNLSTGDTLLVLKENIPVQRGWGTYIINLSGELDCTIEVPHPIWDTKSWRLGILDFLSLRATWFIMAGTHRYANTDSSSDVAHETQTIFHKAHQVIASSKAIQIHGFSKSDPVYNGYPDVVISSGTTSPQNTLFTVKSAYETQGMTAGVYSFSTQTALSRLAATTNKQGQWSNSNGKLFIHIEHDTPIRTDSVKTEKAVAALKLALGNVTDIRNENVERVGLCKLYQNYPNPFNPSTTITYSVPARSAMTLKICAVDGKEIATIFEGIQEAGIAHVTLDAEKLRLAGGVYFVSLTTGTQKQVKKILYMQ